MASPALALRPGTTAARAPGLPGLWAIGLAGCVAAVSTIALALESEGPPDPLVRAITVDAIIASVLPHGARRSARASREPILRVEWLMAGVLGVLPDGVAHRRANR